LVWSLLKAAQLARNMGARRENYLFFFLYEFGIINMVINNAK
jgi:hypothetical protein